METLGPFKGICRVILGLHRDNGQENAHYYTALWGLYRGIIFRGYNGITEKIMDTTVEGLGIRV